MSIEKPLQAGKSLLLLFMRGKILSPQLKGKVLSCGNFEGRMFRHGEISRHRLNVQQIRDFMPRYLAMGHSAVQTPFTSVSCFQF